MEVIYLINFREKRNKKNKIKKIQTVINKKLMIERKRKQELGQIGQMIIKRELGIGGIDDFP